MITLDSDVVGLLKKKSDMYESCIGRAMRTRRTKGGPSRLEVDYYADAMDICEEIKRLFSTDPDIVAKWERIRLDCEEKGRKVLAEMGYKPKDPTPSAPAAPEEKKTPAPAAPQKPAATTSPSPDHDPRPVTETATGFKTRNANEHVSAETIESWYKSKPAHGLKDLIGMDDLVEKLMMIAGDLGMTETDKLLKLSPDKGILLYGFHGNGKTHSIQAFVNYMMNKDANTKFIHLKGSEIISPYVGEAGKILSAAFQEAIDNAPAVLFFDELDNICPSRNSSKEAHQHNLTNAFLESYNQLVYSKASVVVFGATNNPWKVDAPASNRFKAKILVPLPSEEARKNYLKHRFEDITISDDLSLDAIASDTDNFDFRDLGGLCEGLATKLKHKAMKLHNADELPPAEKDEIVRKSLKEGEVTLTLEDYDFIRGDYSATVTEEERQMLNDYVASLKNA